MPAIDWTTQQRRAIETVDRDVLVSAAAGSGKTAVLAERCAYIVANAPDPFRCDVDQLLVVTFTDAAAAEMRSRIHKSLRAKATNAPNDKRLQSQVDLVDTAQISTLHAFCMSIVRRWFHRAGVDAMSPMLSQDEGVLLRHDVIDGLFEQLYAGDDSFTKSFRELVEDYGLGSDAAIKQFVLKLAGFLESIPEPDAWLDHAGDFAPERVDGVLSDSVEALKRELQRQHEHCQQLVEELPTNWPASAAYCQKVVEYQEYLDSWGGRLSSAGEYDAVRREIEAFEFSSKRAPATAKDADPEEKAARDQGLKAYTFVRSSLFQKRLRMRFCRFTGDELRQGVEAIQPYVETLVELVRRYRERYRLAKRDIGMMDFSDLERLAYDLLIETLEGEAENPVVSQLRGRFAHVLVDEFQDINPLQAKILSLVSHENASAGHGNLFTVGDVKQSIYRFRLAEPNMFLARAQSLDDDPALGDRIHLQQNYRSTPTILEGVNLLFGALMTSACGGIDYDDDARLKPPDSCVAGGEPIELHILERKVGTEQSDDEAESEFVDPDDPVHWKAIEREARLVGGRILALMDGGLRVPEGDRERPLRFGDCCILLRSAYQSARHVASVLKQMGIPSWAQQSADAFGRLEIRESLALLSVIDNLRQDIPLATVLRCGILGARYSENELVSIRAIDRSGDFHEAVLRYESNGGDANLRAKLSGTLSMIREYRRQMRERPLADVLWSIYRETGYLSYVCGLKDGAQRRENLLSLHDRARKFGDFRRQGLRRFLQYIESLQVRGEELKGASGRNESDDTVTISTIHHAKGLEYPVVIVMELGRRFNLGDSTGRMLFEREMGIGLKRVERDRLVEYPTALHRRCAMAAEEATLAEELRVWYVATTRAKQKLIMVGTEKLDAIKLESTKRTTPSRVLDPITILSARTPLNWVLAALASEVEGRVRWGAGQVHGIALFEVSTYDESAIAGMRIANKDDSGLVDLWSRVARLEALPDAEPINQVPTQAEWVMGRLDFAYPHIAACSIGAVRSASEKHQSFAAVVGEDDDVVVRPKPSSSTFRRVDPKNSQAEAMARGTAMHAALQFINLGHTSSSEQIQAEMERMVAEHLLDTDQLEHIDIDQIKWFFGTPLGERIRSGADTFDREWMYLASEPLERFDRLVHGEADDRILVRGVVDGILKHGDALEIVDYKTDRVGKADVGNRAESYLRQLALYASAASSVYQRPVRSAHLAFLYPREIVTVSSDQIDGVLDT
ncbi:MAG: ATP-dependent helicase/nuclease subunit A [Phycisphaerae bacterium]|nr:MAG: ATP-dependent helicase/nuclease subunit A [Phycisphaerae bacterium]